MLFLQIFFRRKAGQGTVADRGADLAEKFGPDVPGGKDAGNAGSHIIIGFNEAVFIQGQQIRAQPGGDGFDAHEDKDAGDGQIGFLAGFDIF